MSDNPGYFTRKARSLYDYAESDWKSFDICVFIVVILLLVYLSFDIYFYSQIYNNGTGAPVTYNQALGMIIIDGILIFFLALVFIFYIVKFVRPSRASAAAASTAAAARRLGAAGAERWRRFRSDPDYCNEGTFNGTPIYRDTKSGKGSTTWIYGKRPGNRPMEQQMETFSYGNDEQL